MVRGARATPLRAEHKRGECSGRAPLLVPQCRITAVLSCTAVEPLPAGGPAGTPAGLCNRTRSLSDTNTARAGAKPDGGEGELRALRASKPDPRGGSPTPACVQTCRPVLRAKARPRKASSTAGGSVQDDAAKQDQDGRREPQRRPKPSRSVPTPTGCFVFSRRPQVPSNGPGRRSDFAIPSAAVVDVVHIELSVPGDVVSGRIPVSCLFW